MSEEQREEYEYLQWFYLNADFGPADSDVRYYLNQKYTAETGNQVPEGYSEE